jgi:hypothetical protein
MGCVGFDLARRNPPSWSWQPSVAPRPHPLGAAKVGDTGVGANACAREGDDVLAGNDPSSDCLDMLFEALFVGHAKCLRLVHGLASTRILRFWCTLVSGSAPPALLPHPYFSESSGGSQGILTLALKGLQPSFVLKAFRTLCIRSDSPADSSPWQFRYTAAQTQNIPSCASVSC